ncbi:myosin light chain kinase A-like [Oppia nitens]|uniref:myosin light chain kinase A-like n=1 Tax=Oppia nitens TaxID=1686743 RepID=UPI0023DB7229|nr:myosin light chain kinase A-like [Oppia nitens]
MGNCLLTLKSNVLMCYECCCDCCLCNKKVKNRFHHKTSSEVSKKTVKTFWEEKPFVDRDSLTVSQIPITKISRNISISENNERLKGNEKQFDSMVLSLENYECLENVGKGAHGVVYKVRNKETNHLFAVKVMILSTKFQNYLSRINTFKNEIFHLRRHPHHNIIGLKDHFVCKHQISYMIMELAISGDLSHILKTRSQPFSEEMAKSYFVQIYNAIHYLHYKSLYHGDMKLANVLIAIVDNKEVVKVSDFGNCRIAYSNETGDIIKNKAVGTVAYMAPEIIRVYIDVNLNCKGVSKTVNGYNPQKGDMWALGVSFYELLSKQRPFTYRSKEPKDLQKMLKDMKKGYNMPSNIANKLSADCMLILKKLLHYDKDERFNSFSLKSHKYITESSEYIPVTNITVKLN